MGKDNTDCDDMPERIAELVRLLDKARAEAKRMDLARDQFLGERNMLAEALRDIQRGDMTGMMELTVAEAAKARATWALKRIGTPVAALTPAGGWQPIETAPHETLAVLGWYEGDVWKQEIALASAGTRYPNGYSDRWQHGRASHWRPLPDPPTTPEAEGGEDAE